MWNPKATNYELVEVRVAIISHLTNIARNYFSPIFAVRERAEGLFAGHLSSFQLDLNLKNAEASAFMLKYSKAKVAELVDAHDSKSCIFGCVGSIPTFGT